jgi:hypothetical protein
VRIDSSGKVGIGTSSPARILHVENNGLADLLLRDTSSYSVGTGPAVIFQGKESGGTNTQFGAIYGVSNGSNSGELTFETRNSGSSAERMRIDTSGNLLVGTTSTTQDTSNFGTRIGGTDAPGYLASYRDVSGTTVAVRFGGNAGQVYVRGDGDLENTNNNYGAISDERLKSDIVDASSQIDDIMAVQVRSYTLNETGDTHIGVVAQELEASGMSGLVKTDDEGMKSVKYSILYMKAIKALQEAVTRIETLEAEVAALKGE